MGELGDRCIQLSLGYADMCVATEAVLVRQTEPNHGVPRDPLGACVSACRVCGSERQKHADHHEHCLVCADSCRRCVEACKRLMETLPSRS